MIERSTESFKKTREKKRDTDPTKENAITMSMRFDQLLINEPYASIQGNRQTILLMNKRRRALSNFQ